VKLTIVIPALNEEQAIGSIIERCLAARPPIVAGSPIDETEIIVVSDGSTDRTAQIAAGYKDIRVIVFERNRGYGAAIKRGFEEGTGELVGFLDADGTCDPNFFANLCTAVIDEGASVAVGSRMGPDSRMPMIRKLGNRLYALILSILSNRVVTDTASGMRVIRRDALRRLYPLPMDNRMTMVERPMRYEERIGESKLQVWHDGLRFLRTIFEMSFMWQPAKLFLLAAVISLALMTLLAMHPIETWLRVGQLQEDMIYRLLFCSLMGTFGATLLSAGVLCQHLYRLLDNGGGRRGERGGAGEPATTFVSTALGCLYTFRGSVGILLPAVPLLVWLVGRGVWTRAADGFVDLHWSRIVLAGLIVFGIGQMLSTVLIVNVLRFHIARKSLDTPPATAKCATAGASALVGGEGLKVEGRTSKGERQRAKSEGLKSKVGSRKSKVPRSKVQTCDL
jgi:glycosyltransferase involved in cell wall biosynthesis